MITFDFETKSYADLTKVGAWAYSLHNTTEVICCAYKIDDNEIQTWWPGKLLVDNQAGSPIADMPNDLYQALRVSRDTIEAHQVGFERSIWINIMVPEYGWLLPDDEQWRDSMATAAYYALPMALDRLSRVLGFEGKNPEGTRLISKYSKLHLKTAVDEIPEEDFNKFVQYCCDDVDQESKVSDFLGDLPEEELDVFFLDQEINLRGIYLDEKTIRDAMAIVETRAKDLASAFKEITGVAPSQHDKVKQWFINMGCPMENLQADYIDEVLEGHHDFEPTGYARQALELRKSYNKASTKKLAAMLRNRSKTDGRARFQTRYHGAFTGRWTGTGFQPLNMSKGFESVPPEQLVADLSHRDPKFLDAMYGDAMEAVGKATRHHIRAEKGSRIIAGDFVSIEAVVLSCLAGEDWKVEAFHNRDPIYELMGCEIHKLGPEAEALARRDKAAFKDKYPSERFDGKTGELAFGYQGGLGAWRKFDSKPYTHSDDRVIEICKTWRDRHPNIRQHWYDLENAAVRCVKDNVETEVNMISFRCIDEWLSMRLPSGKRIWYWQPELRLGMPPWHKPDSDDEKYEDCRLGICDCRPRHSLTYMAQKEGQWKRVWTYGGKFAENEAQGTSREILIPAMLKLRKYSYNIILSVYDEIVCEMPYGKGSVEEVAEIMAESAGQWAYYNGRPWPIFVDVWEGERYRK